MRAMHKWAIVGLAACSDAGNFTPIPPDLDVPGPDPVVASVALTPEAPCTTDPIVATVSGGQPVSFSWTVDGRPSPVDGAVVGSDLTTRDQSWAVSVLVDGAPVAATSQVTVRSCPPEVLSVRVVPGVPRVTDALAAEVEASDPDGDVIAFDYRWFVDGAVVDGQLSAWLPAGLARKHQVVAVEVTPRDDVAAGDPARSPDVAVLNTAPTAPTIAISPDAPFAPDPLTCAIGTPSVDADGDTIAYTFVWTVDGAPFTGATDGARPGDTVPAAATEAGQVWTCAVTASDGEVETSPVEASVEVLGGLVPCGGVNTGEDYSSGTTMGGPDLLLGMRHVASSSVRVGRVEVFTGGRGGSNAVSMYTHDSARDRPDAAIATGAWESGSDRVWQGADLERCASLTAGQTYWVVWAPVNGSQASLQPSGTSVTYRGSFDRGASWNGPFSGAWKYKLYCCE
jgi:hypothetical protein